MPHKCQDIWIELCPTYYMYAVSWKIIKSGRETVLDLNIIAIFLIEPSVQNMNIHVAQTYNELSYHIYLPYGAVMQGLIEAVMQGT
jgi:hypothetical protein